MTATRLTSRAVIRLSPQGEDEDVIDFLQGLVTNDVTGDLPVWAGLLSPQGKALFDFLVWRAPAPAEAGGGDLLLDCEAEAALPLARRLSLYRLRRRIDIALDPTLAVHWAATSRDDAVADPRLAALGWRWLAPRSEDDGTADAAWLEHRLKHGVAEGRAELGDGETLWLECNADLLNGVSFTKGCYIGQENTARMNWRQKINRRLLVVPLADSDPVRQRAVWPALGLALDLRRVEDIAEDIKPDWMEI